MQIKKWLFDARIANGIFFILTGYLSMTHAAGDSMARIEKVMEKNRNKIVQQKRSPLTRQMQKPIIIAEKKINKIDPALLTPRQRRRERRKKVSEARIVKHMSEMTYEELTKTKNKHHAENNLEVALKYVDRLLLMCDPHESADLILEAGDILFKLKEYNKAAARYAEFVLLYPGNERIEYATYCGIKARFTTTLSSDRDQTFTNETLALIDTYLERESVFTHYLKEVKEIQKECFKKLAESELYVSEYYIKQESFKPAVARLKKVKNEYLAKIPELQTKFKELTQLLPKEQKSLLFEQPEVTPPSDATSTIVLAENIKSKPAKDRF